MNEQTLLRLAMVLQNQAPSTLNKYICKLAVAILVENPDGVGIDELAQKINEQFNLDFSDDEIKRALTKKGTLDIIYENGVYSATEKTILSYQRADSYYVELRNTISRFLANSQFDISENQLFELLLNYLYFCFNSNVDNLLALFNKKEITTTLSVFEASNDDIDVINSFIEWEDKEKDSLVYHIVAACYEYCMLTIKKDSILSKELFKGKRFYLDANIIFRMAGINNEDRQFVTKSFEKYCKEAGIGLVCSSSTVDELYRVIESEVKFIQSIFGSDQPLSCDTLERVNPSLEINDFYKRYYEWSQMPGNHYGDYVAFSRYLFDLVQNTITNLNIRQSGSYKIGHDNESFSAQVQNLITYKNSKRKRQTTIASAETDVTNIRDILEARHGNGTSMWQTNDFLVSADHRLIGWANEVYPGVPIVVLPSVWLSVILRYTGRTDDDYKSFCLFLTQRQHTNSREVIDTPALVKNINLRTNKTEIKELIISEITQNKSQYAFETEEDYSYSVDKAFDKVLTDFYHKTETQIADLRVQMQSQLQNQRDDSEEKKRQAISGEQEKTVMILAKERAHKKVMVFAFINQNEWIIYLFAGIVLFASIMIWIFEWQPLFSYIVSKLPEKTTNSAEAFSLVWTILSTALGLVFVGLGKVVSRLGSQERESKLSDIYYKKDIKKVRETDETRPIHICK